MPSAGSTIVGFAPGSSVPRHSGASRHDTMREVRSERSGSAPAIVHPMRPELSATRKFCGGPCHPRAVASASSSVFAFASSKRPQSRPPSRSGAHRNASIVPSSRVSTIGPNSVVRSVTSSALVPVPTRTTRVTKAWLPLLVWYRVGSVGSASTTIKSARSAVRFVNAHATWPFVPCTMSGTPGSDKPSSVCSGHKSRTRYQMPGAVSIKCMSLATIARPSLVREPATAKAFEPGCTSRVEIDSALDGDCVRAGSAAFDLARRRSSAAASGIAIGCGSGEPSMERSRVPRLEVKNSATFGNARKSGVRARSACGELSRYRAMPS